MMTEDTLLKATGRLQRIWKQTFSAFGDRNFRWYSLGMGSASTAFRIEEVAQGWLVYNLTGSALALGWVRMGWSVAIIAIALVGGIVADRVKKQTILVVGNGLVGLIPLAIGLLVITDTIRWWHLVIGALLEGLIFSFTTPARHVFMAILRGSQGILNAMALEIFTLALPGIIFSAIGGALLEWIGVSQVYFLIALIYGLAVVMFLRLSVEGQTSRVQFSFQSELMAGFRYVFHHPKVMPVLGLGIARTILLAPIQTFLPVFAADVFRTGAFGLGQLAAAWSLGRVIGSLLVATLGDYRHKGRLLLGLGAASGGFVVLFAQSRSFYLALILIAIVSMAQNAYMVTEGAILQSVASEDMRGRVAGFLRLNQGMVALAILPVGFMVDLWGAPSIISMTGLTATSIFLLLMIRRSGLTRLQ